MTRYFIFNPDTGFRSSLHTCKLLSASLFYFIHKPNIPIFHLSFTFAPSI